MVAVSADTVRVRPSGDMSTTNRLPLVLDLRVKKVNIYLAMYLVILLPQKFYSYVKIK